MKLLLTSGGLRNQELLIALFDLAGKPAKELKVVFVPTAANVENEDKSWLIDDLIRLKDQGFAWLDIVDFPGLTKEHWLPRFEQADVLIFEGGSTEYLVEKIKESGLEDELMRWLKTKTYVGISAGSVMMGSVINPKGTTGFNLVDFLVTPHMGSPFSKRTIEEVEAYAQKFSKKVYWLDDNAAVKVDGDGIQVVGGESKEFN